MTSFNPPPPDPFNPPKGPIDHKPVEQDETPAFAKVLAWIFVVFILLIMIGLGVRLLVAVWS